MVLWSNMTASQLTNDCISKSLKIDESLFGFQERVSGTSASIFTNLYERAFFSNMCELITDQGNHATNCSIIMDGNLVNVSLVHSGSSICTESYHQLDEFFQFTDHE